MKSTSMAKKRVGATSECIVVGMDFSPASDRAFAFSINLAKKLKGTLTAVFVKNYDDLALAIRQEIRGVNLRDRKLLAKEVDHYIQERFQSVCKIHGKDYNRIRLVVVSGKPWREILKVARRVKATLIFSQLLPARLRCGRQGTWRARRPALQIGFFTFFNRRFLKR